MRQQLTGSKVGQTALRAARRRLQSAPVSTTRSNSSDKNLARVADLTAKAKTTWFALLSFLAFVSITLMGVQDVDFFLTERETALPLIGVSVPTFLFFSVTPFLGLILYSYFQMHLLKLWEALADCPGTIDGAPLSDRVPAWLISDIALAHRPDGALRLRPLARSAY